jgi:hypothetical protein
MPRLLALIPEDGFAIVRDGESAVFVRPPFAADARHVVTEAVVFAAIGRHGYEAQPEAPEEPWSSVVERIRATMTRVPFTEMNNAEALRRSLAAGPASLFYSLVERIERDWLAGDRAAAERAVAALLANDRVARDPILLGRVQACAHELARGSGGA